MMNEHSWLFYWLLGRRQRAWVVAQKFCMIGFFTDSNSRGKSMDWSDYKFSPHQTSPTILPFMTTNKLASKLVKIFIDTYGLEYHAPQKKEPNENCPHNKK